MNTLEKNLLNAVKFINLKKLSNAGFIVEKNQAVFYSGKIILMLVLKIGLIYQKPNFLTF